MRIKINTTHNDQTTESGYLEANKPEIAEGDSSRLASLAEKKSIHAKVCIYCGSLQSLSDEHVIPYALGGNLQIFRGSCEVCRQKTSRFENLALNGGAMAEVRKARGIQSRSSHSSARPVTVVALVKNGAQAHVEIGTQHVPVLLGFPWFSQPGLLTQRGNSQMLLEGWFPASFGPEIDTFLKEHGASELRIEESRKDVVAFAQTMAKIAYAYAWLDGIFNVVSGRDLVDAFMNTPDELGAFVGMKPPPLEQFPGLAFRLEYRIKVPELYVFMEVQPFPDVPAPTYLVVLGRCIDLRSWRRVRRRIASGFD